MTKWRAGLRPLKPEDLKRFTAERLQLAPGAEMTDMEIRAEFVAWCSDHFIRVGQYRGLGRAVVEFGAKRRLRPLLRYEGVAPKPLLDSGYRVGNPGGASWGQQGWSGVVAPKPAVTEALRALHAAGLVTDRGALNGAWLELTS